MSMQCLQLSIIKSLRRYHFPVGGRLEISACVSRFGIQVDVNVVDLRWTGSICCCWSQWNANWGINVIMRQTQDVKGGHSDSQKFVVFFGNVSISMERERNNELICSKCN